jgi:iron complex outermembrane receptor protein
LEAQISGVIMDQISDEPLIGVNISVTNNLNIGTISDYNGAFIINANVGDTLVFSYIGYQSQKLAITSQDNLTIYLSESSKFLDEVVVIGYGAVDKNDLTGVVSKVNEKDFLQGSLSSPEKLLTGKVAGLQLSNNGEPGGGTRLRIRGGTSLDASSDPLIVIDGVPMDSRDFVSSRNSLNFINAADVESMTVLKDASAAAIYGSRGANGVIIITTKSGKKGKLKINYNGNANISMFSGTPSNLTTNTFKNAIQAKAPEEFEFLGNENTDWVKEVTQLTTSTEHNASISGGSDIFKYRVSGGYLKSNGVLKTSSHEKLSGSARLSTKLLNNNISISLKSRIGNTDDRFTPDVFGSALAFDPTRPVYDQNSEFGGFFQWDDRLATNNPVATLLQTNNTGQTTRTLNNLTTKINIPWVKGLSITSNLSYDYTSGKKRDFSDPLEKSNFDRGGRLFNETLTNKSTLIESYGSYDFELTAINSKINFTAGHSWQEFDQQNDWEFGNGLILDENGGYIYTEDIAQDSFSVTNRLISFFGRTNITIKDKYLVTGSLRSDGSSRFGLENQWGLFPAVAVAWRILEEDFSRGLSNIFSNLKLRGSWGITGNEDIPDYLFKTFYRYGTPDASYQFGDSYIPTLRGTGVDPGIKWEETSSLNFGIDYGFFNNRLSGTIELYQKNTKDLLFTVAAPAFTNLSDRILTNVGEIENRGLEITTNAVMIDKTQVDWNLGFNVAFNKNEIKKLDNSNLNNLIAEIKDEDPNAYIPDFFGGYEAGGISGDVGQTIQFLRQGVSTQTFLTYLHKRDGSGNPLNDFTDHNGDGFVDNLDIYEDLNNDGIINEEDLKLGENAAPKVMLGLNSSVRYKNWDFSTSMRAHFGNYVYNNVASSTGFYERLSDRETNNIHESAIFNDFKTRQLKSDVYIENASFLKIDNLTIGYNIGNRGLLQSMRIYTTISNLITITGYSGFDPELAQFNGGIDNNLYPISRNFLVGINANF